MGEAVGLSVGSVAVGMFEALKMGERVRKVENEAVDKAVVGKGEGVSVGKGEGVSVFAFVVATGDAVPVAAVTTGVVGAGVAVIVENIVVARGVRVPKGLGELMPAVASGVVGAGD